MVPCEWMQVKIWFQNRRTKWKKQENLSNAEAAEHRACAEHRRSSDHRRRSSVGIEDSSPGRGVRHSPPSIINHPPCNPLTVALAGASPALQFPRVFVSCSPAVAAAAAAVTSLAHDPAFRLPPPPVTDCRCDVIPPVPLTSFRPSPILPVSRRDDVTRRRESASSPAADQVELTADESAVVGRTDSRHDSDVILPVKELTEVDNVGSNGSVRETE